MNVVESPRRSAAAARVAIALSFSGAVALGLGGCASGAKSQADKLAAENAQLRNENLEKQRELDQLRATRAATPAYEGDSSRGSDEFGPNTTTTHGGGEVVVEIAGELLFDSGSIVLKASSKSTLSHVASVIKDRYSDNRIRVEGYTDSDPIKKSKFESNEDLSARRALAVEKYLVSRGIDADTIYSAAMGPANPKGTKKASRRVEIVILGAS